MLFALVVIPRRFSGFFIRIRRFHHVIYNNKQYDGKNNIFGGKNVHQDFPKFPQPSKQLHYPAATCLVIGNDEFITPVFLPAGFIMFVANRLFLAITDE